MNPDKLKNAASELKTTVETTLGCAAANAKVVLADAADTAESKAQAVVDRIKTALKK